MRRASTRVSEEIVSLRASDGRWYPQLIVEWARQNPDSALHGHFEWDVAKAAYDHWLWQARQLIAIHVVDVSGGRQTISLIVDRPKGGGYRELGEVVSNAEMRRDAVDQAIAELRRWRERYGFLQADLSGVFRAIDRIPDPLAAKDAA